MNHPPKTDRELTGLIEQWQLGDLNEMDATRLVEKLECDPAARKAFIDATMMEAMLHCEFPDSVVHFPQRRAAWFRRPAAMFAVAASIVIGVGLLFVLDHSGSSRNSPPISHAPDGKERVRHRLPSAGTQLAETSPIARVASLTEVVLDTGSLALVKDGLLSPGTIKLKSGKLEITFFSGARVSLEGPCRFHLKSDFRATLVHGRLTADVPPQATGFTIHTPSGQLRDLGTAFAVDVRPNGDADVHVLDGMVEASPRDSTTLVTLTGSQASRMSGGKLIPITFLADGWPSRPNSRYTPEMPRSVHWSLDRFDNDQSVDSAGVHPLWMRSAGSDVSAVDPSKRLHQGVRGQALSFNGVDEYAESTYRGVSGDNPRSVAFWVRIPPDASSYYPNGMVSWGSHRQSRKWQVCWNNGDQGTVGALRVEFGDGYLIGTTDLRDGLWHHLAVVFLGGTGSDVASHVKLYVDGRLETLSGRRSQVIRTDTESPRATAVTLGRWLGNWPGKEPFHFHGSLDEVFIFEDALSPSQVAKLAVGDPS
jgi:hypothetical protein